MKIFAIIGGIVVVFLAGLLGVYGTMRAGLWATQYDKVVAKWAAGPADKFVKVDGVNLHVTDEGQGPVVVMLHGSIINLHEWDPVVDRLKAHYRIIRLDWPPYGVSGQDPTGVYTTPRETELLAKLVDQMHLGRFSVVSTSNGANIALQYVTDHPEHVSAMAFSILPLVRPSQTRKVDPLLKNVAAFHAAYLPDYHPKYWWRLMLKDTTNKDFHPPARLVDMLYDMDNLPGAAKRQRAFIAANVKLFHSVNVAALAANVRVPVLLQWCSLDTVIAQSEAQSVADFKNTKVDLITYKDLGHFPMWEDPDRFTGDLKTFLDRVTAQTPTASAQAAH